MTTSSKNGDAMNCYERVLLLFALAMFGGCGPELEELDMSVTVEGESVSVSWDGRPVHQFDVFLMEGNDGTGVWGVSTAEDPFSAPRHDPTIVPTLRYGQPVDNAFVRYGPEVLVRGATYQVQINVLGWEETCEEEGVDLDPAAFEDPSSDCVIAIGRENFTF